MACQQDRAVPALPPISGPGLSPTLPFPPGCVAQPQWHPSAGGSGLCPHNPPTTMNVDCELGRGVRTPRCGNWASPEFDEDDGIPGLRVHSTADGLPEASKLTDWLNVPPDPWHDLRDLPHQYPRTGRVAAMLPLGGLSTLGANCVLRKLGAAV